MDMAATSKQPITLRLSVTCIFLLCLTIVIGQQPNDPDDDKTSVSDPIKNGARVVHNNGKVHCPTKCECSRFFVNCTNAGLNDVPKYLPGNITELILARNNISDVGIGKFQYLSALRKLDLSSNVITRLYGKTFVGLKALRHLLIANNRLKSIEPDTFSTYNLPFLRYLNVSYNQHLGFGSISDITFGIQNNTNFRVLAVRKLEQTFGPCIVLKSKHVKYMRNLSIQALYFDSNRLAYIDDDTLQYLPNTLKYLSVTDNIFLVGNYIIPFLQGTILKNLITLKLSDQRKAHSLGELAMVSHNVKAIPYNESGPLSQSQPDNTTNGPIVNDALMQSEEIRRPNLRNRRALDPGLKAPDTAGPPCIFPVRLPPKLRTIDYSNNKITAPLGELCLDGDNNLTTINISGNTFWQWNESFTGFDHLKYLDLSINRCSQVSSKFFDGFSTLIELNISRNFLGYDLSNDISGRILSNLTSLRRLDLADNRIRELPRDLFKGLKKLEKLILKYNRISDVNWRLDYMPRLMYLNLQENFLTHLTVETTDYLDERTNHVNFTLNLSNNSLTCTCQTMPFVKWAAETRVLFENLNSTFCKMDNGSLVNLGYATEIYRILEHSCASYTLIIVGTSIGFAPFLIILAAIIAYRYRWDMRYMYYSAILKWKGYVPLRQDDEDFEYEAFIAYSEQDRLFVKNHLVPELRDKRQMTLLIHDLHFRAGNYVTENIVEAVTISRRTLIVLSRSFIDSKWCRYEMNMARQEGIRTGRNSLCVLKVEDVPMSRLPLEITDVIRNRTYLEPPRNQANMDIFWDRVKSALTE